MHELSIASSIVELACEQMERLGARRVDAIHLRLGKLSGVVKEALLFSFDAASAGSAVEGARLAIEEVPVTAWCEGCVAEREIASASRRRCPVCDAVTPTILRGTELEVTGMEILPA